VRATGVDLWANALPIVANQQSVVAEQLSKRDAAEPRAELAQKRPAVGKMGFPHGNGTLRLSYSLNILAHHLAGRKSREHGTNIMGQTKTHWR
jgi:hypothetical protein